MSDKKQSSVDFILNAFNLLSDSDFKAWMLNNHDEIKAMHKEEIEEAYDAIIFDDNGILLGANKYYNEKFGGQYNE
jgi:hypothetical protein